MEVMKQRRNNHMLNFRQMAFYQLMNKKFKLRNIPYLELFKFNVLQIRF